MKHPTPKNAASSGSSPLDDSAPSELSKALTYRTDTKFQRAMAVVKAESRELARALTSKDPPTRWMALLFYTSLIALFGVTFEAVRYIQYVQSTWVHVPTELELQLKEKAEFNERQAVREAFKDTMVKLGRFIVELKPQESDQALGKWTAEFELVVRLNDTEARDYVDARTVQARGEVVTALLHIKRSDLLTTAGKRETDKKLVAQLQTWLTHEYPKAKVEDVFFTNLLVR